MEEIGEISKTDYNLQKYNLEEAYPSGVYECACGKRFHGHWNRTAHKANCDWSQIELDSQ